MSYGREKAQKAQRGQPQPKELTTDFADFTDSEFSIHAAPQNEIGTAANEGNEEVFLLRFLRFLLFNGNPCLP